MKIFSNKYLQAFLRHSIAAGGVYLASKGLPEAWVIPAVSLAISFLDKYKET